MRTGHWLIGVGALAYGTAHAASLDFGIISPTSGSLSYAGGVSSLVGTNIDVDEIVGLATPLNENVVSLCGSCSLDFTTGVSTGGWSFGAGGTISITGSVDFPVGTDIPAGTTLLSGTFNTATIVDLGSGNFEFQIAGGTFNDRKHPDLLAFYGLPDIGYVGGFNLSFSTTADMGNAFSTTSLGSGDIINQPVPIPPAAWLFGSGLLGLAGIARRRRS